jgi:hypothetical protein
MFAVIEGIIRTLVCRDSRVAVEAYVESEISSVFVLLFLLSFMSPGKVVRGLLPSIL